MATIIFVAVCAWLGGMGLTYIMFAGIVQIERQREVYPAIRNEPIPIPVCHPDRHSTLTSAYQDATQEDDYEADIYAAGLADEIETLERDAHEYRQEIRRLRDELAELRFPAPVVSTAGRYNVVDRFAYLEVSE